MGSVGDRLEILSSVEWNKQLFLSDLMSVTAEARCRHALIDEDSFGERAMANREGRGRDMLCIICISD